MYSKDFQREKFKEIRKEEVQKNEGLIVAQVEKTLKSLFKKGSKKHIGIYWPLDGEVNLKALKSTCKFLFALPASNHLGGITYHKWTGEKLGEDALGIPSPINEISLDHKEMDLLLVPGLAVDKRGFRLGYGGGYFDRLRSNLGWQSVKALVIIPKACVSNDSWPIDNWDIPFDGWINEEGCFEAESHQTNN